MTKQSETYLSLSNPSPKSGFESRLIKADLDARIAASEPKRPRIGALPTPPLNLKTDEREPVDEVPFIDSDESDKADPDEEVTEKTHAFVTIPR